MKAIISILFSLSLSSSVLAVGLEGTEFVSFKHRNLFVFKTEKKLIGAKVDVFFSNGDLVTTQWLDRKKMILDFREARYGTYTICVTKGNKKKLYQYVKK